MKQFISSKDNQTLKHLALLHDRRKAQKENKVFIEGKRLCEDALLSGIVPETIVYTDDTESVFDEWCNKYSLSESNTYMIKTTNQCFSKIASTNAPQGLAIVFSQDKCNVQRWQGNGISVLPESKDKKDIYLVLEDIQDPGNLGTMIRMADAFDFTSILITKNTVDPYNEKVMRASMGSCWHIPVYIFENITDILSELDQKRMTKVAMHLKGEVMDEAEFEFPVAYLIGNEGNGLSDVASSGCDKLVKIPMYGKAESLNAASAASIVGYVLSGQKQKKY